MLGENLIQVGTLNKVGTPVNGRQNYEVTNHLQEKYTYSIPQENADKFEKLYAQTDELVKEAKSPEAQARLEENGRKIGKNYKNLVVYGTAVGATIGGLVPIVAAVGLKGSAVKRTILGGFGAIAGVVIGSAVALDGSFQYSKHKIASVVAKEPSFKKLDELSNQARDLGLKEEKKNLTNV